MPLVDVLQPDIYWPAASPRCSRSALAWPTTCRCIPHGHSVPATIHLIRLTARHRVPAVGVSGQVEHYSSVLPQAAHRAGRWQGHVADHAGHRHGAGRSSRAGDGGAMFLIFIPLGGPMIKIAEVFHPDPRALAPHQVRRRLCGGRLRPAAHLGAAIEADVGAELYAAAADEDGVCRRRL